MCSIIMHGHTFLGIGVVGRGVFTNDKYGWTYAGQHRDGYARGLGVLTWSGMYKEYAEHGPDGKYVGRFLGRHADGDAWYYLVERGNPKAEAFVLADGRRMYNGVDCAPDDPRFLALIAQVTPVEVRPAALEPATRHSDPKQSPD